MVAVRIITSDLAAVFCSLVDWLVVLSERVLHAERDDRCGLVSNCSKAGVRSVTISIEATLQAGVQRIHGGALAHAVVITQGKLSRARVGSSGSTGFAIATLGVSQLDRIGAADAELAGQMEVVLLGFSFN